MRKSGFQNTFGGGPFDAMLIKFSSCPDITNLNELIEIPDELQVNDLGQIDISTHTIGTYKYILNHHINEIKSKIPIEFRIIPEFYYKTNTFRNSKTKKNQFPF